MSQETNAVTTAHRWAVRTARLTSLAVFLCACSEAHEPSVRKVELALVGEVGRGVFNRPGPLSFEGMAIGRRGVYVYDSQGEVPFYLVERLSFEIQGSTAKASFKIQGFGSWGPGPGELQRGFPVTLRVVDSLLFVHAPFESKLLVYTEELTLHREENLAQALPGIGTLYPVADTLAVFLGWDLASDSTNFAQVVRITSEGLVPTRRGLGEYQALPTLEPLRRNPMLKIGPVHVDAAGRFFWAHYYSSLRLGFSESGQLLFASSEPRRVPIPEAPVREAGGVIAGDPESAVQSYLALASDRRYLYGLYSGEVLTRDRVLAQRLGRSTEELRLGEGRLVDVFDPHGGHHRFSFELPEWAIAIAIDDEFLYLLTLEDEPQLLVYRKPAELVE